MVAKGHNVLCVTKFFPIQA